MLLIHPKVPGLAGLALLVMAWGTSGSSDASEPAGNQNGSINGHELFLRDWVPGDPRSHGGDGLGPLYNATSCVACHNLGAPGGAGPASKNVEIVSLVRSLAMTNDSSIDDYHPGFRQSPSLLLHRFGTDPEFNLWRLRRVGGVEFADMAEQGGVAEIEQIRERMDLKPGSRTSISFRRSRPAPRGTGRVKGDVLLSNVATLTQRNPPPLFGVGLIDRIPIEALRESALHSNGDIQGRLNWLKDGRVGRFGWKAQTPSLKEFVESACAMELGLEVPTQHQAKAPLNFSKTTTGLDLTQGECDALTSYIASLPAPIQRGEEIPDLAAGRSLLTKIGCTGCHTPELGPVAGIYSDLLLHDMGSDLADAGRYYGVIERPSVEGARSQEWRTPPLWGFRDSGPYLHDGHAETLEEAVALHGGQSQPSARLYFDLKLKERLQIQTFLNSLAAPAVDPETPR